MPFLPRLSSFVPLKNGFYSLRAQIDQHHPVDPGTSYTAVVPRGLADLYEYTFIFFPFLFRFSLSCLFFPFFSFLCFFFSN